MPLLPNEKYALTRSPPVRLIQLVLRTVVPEVKFTFFLSRLPRLLTNLPADPLCRQKRMNRFFERGKLEMTKSARILPWLLRSLAVPAVLVAALASAQTAPAPARQAAPARQTALAQAPAAPVSDRDLAATQDQLIKLLRMSPTLTTVVAHDPSLLSDQDYVSRNNPQLAQFLVSHPEVARNPDFYLFTHVHRDDGSSDEALERAVWPELVQTRDSWSANDVIQPIAALLAFACFLAALVWLIRQYLENRRWGRIFRLQSEVHGRLIDKFGSNQELAGYMETEAGKRFLEAAPIPVGLEPEQRMPNAIARVLTPLQIGVVLVLLGVGFFLLRHVRTEMYEPMLVLGTVALMPGLGFIISAGITWVLAGRLGLIPEAPAAGSSRLAPSHFDGKDAK
jgi:hypothetical protein